MILRTLPIESIEILKQNERPFLSLVYDKISREISRETLDGIQKGKITVAWNSATQNFVLFQLWLKI